MRSAFHSHRVGVDHVRYNQLGQTGLFISELCLGTVTFDGSGDTWQHIGDLQQADAEHLIGHALDTGISFTDTANMYANDITEQLMGQTLKNLKVSRDNAVVAIKVFGQTDDSMNACGTSRFHIMDGIRASLKCMQPDHIDLYQIHGFDPATPVEETVRTLDTLVQHDHVRYMGVPSQTAWQIVKALSIAGWLGCARFENPQAYYTVTSRGLEHELVPMLGNEGLGLMV